MATNIAAFPGLRELWLETLGDPRIRIAVLDGAVDRGHPCFDGARLSTLSTRIGDAPVGGRMSCHGTHVASVVFGRHDSDIHGIAPKTRGLLGVIYSDRNAAPTSQGDLAHAIHEAVDAGAHVVNISGGEFSSTGQADAALAEAVRYCEDQGVLIVAAAGNDACRCQHVPAALPSVLAVGAMDERGWPLDSSNWGDAYQRQGILAPGHNILGAAPGGGTSVKSGTSYATPIVTGVAGLLLSLQLARGEEPDPIAVGSAILAGATPCDHQLVADCQRFLAGRLNIDSARQSLFKKRRLPMSDNQTVEGSSTNAANQTAPSSDGREAAQHAPNAVAVEPSEPAEASAPSAPATADANGHVAAAAPSKTAPEPRPTWFQATRAPRQAARPSVTRAGSVVASECNCKTNGSGAFVWAVGSLNYDLGTEARRDSFKQRMPEVTPEGLPYLRPFPEPPEPPPPGSFFPPNPYDARQMVNYLAGFPPTEPPFPTQGGFPTLPHYPSGQKGTYKAGKSRPPYYPESPPPFPPPLTEPPQGYRGYPAHLSEATELIWTLNIELTPVYAIRPAGNFSTETYQRLVEFLAGQVRPPEDDDYVSRISLPGTLTGETVQLFSGQIVPVVTPHIRGMYAWSESQLILHVLKVFNIDPESEQGKAARHQLRNFLARVYYELRNLGQTSQERALNYAATNAFQAASIIVELATKFPPEPPREGQPQRPLPAFELQSISVEKSPFCRIDSDCWDVFLKFFYPDNIYKARDLYSYTIDVSDPYPVSIGTLRTWSTPH